MQDTIKPIDLQVVKNECANRIDSFFKRFRIASVASNSQIKKSKGHSAVSILQSIFILPFIGKNIYRNIVINPERKISKDAIYDFLRSSRFSWRRFLLALGFQSYEMIDELTNKDRDPVLIFDDSTISRPRSKNVELLAKVFDHTTGRYLRGFRMLTMAWSDGSTLLPLDFALLSSRKKKHRYQEAAKNLDKRTCGARRRQESVTKATDLITPMIERALHAGINAKYVLMDSWFGVPSLIAKAREHLHVICMVKRTPKIHYIFEGQELNAIQIYRKIRKRRGRAKILANAQVQIKDGGMAKLVFVRNRSKRDWLALLCTDENLPDDEIVRIYGRRWDIEVFFRTAKQHLELEKGCQSRDFDALIAHTSIVMTRYIFLCIEKRRAEDPRTLGILFHHFCQEAADCTLIEALGKILGVIVKNLHKIENLPANVLGSILELVQKNMDSFVGEKGLLVNKNKLLTTNR
jgi:hypothetical protein